MPQIKVRLICRGCTKSETMTLDDLLNIIKIELEGAHPETVWEFYCDPCEQSNLSAALSAIQPGP